jgi:thioredoxin
MATQTITADNFESTIQDHPIVVLDFWATWCGPCRNFAPIFERASEEHAEIVFGKVNTDEEQGLAQSFQIRSIPTLMVFRDQIMLYNNPGALPKTAFDDLLAKVKALDMDHVRAEIARQEQEKATS